MRTLAIDIETYCELPLDKCGVYAYASHSSFTVDLFAYAFDDEEVRVVDLYAGEKLPHAVLTALGDPGVQKTAFNANFERTCLAAWLKQPMLPEQWSCTAVMARELGLPGSLDAVGRVLGLPEDKAKLKEGMALVRFFAIPENRNDVLSRRRPEDYPEKWLRYTQYNAQDVVAEREIRARLAKFRISDWEQSLWETDQRINDYGVLADVEMALNATTIDEAVSGPVKQALSEITGLENPKSQSQMKNWLVERTGLDIMSLDKAAVKELLSTLPSDSLEAHVLRLYRSLGKTSTAKYKAVLNAAGPDNRIRGLTMFYGASRTGRWAGRIVQPQNLPKNHMSDADLDIARQAVVYGDPGTVQTLFDDVPDTLSQLIRTVLIPSPGCRFIVSDFSAIEARVIAWLAGEQWRQEAFAEGKDIYCASASQMFHVPVEKGGINGDLRQKGKIAELALGYGGSVGALKAMGALSMGLSEEELPDLVTQWRVANPAITAFWWDVDRMVKRCLQTGQPQRLHHDIAAYRSGSLLRIRLPSGRDISYVKPLLDSKGGITYEGTYEQGGWGRIETYGPKLVENIVQAISRDCLALSMQRLEQAGIQIVFHVHDEVICDVPKERSSGDEVAQIMGQPIPWASGLLLRAEAYECEYYRKE